MRWSAVLLLAACTPSALPAPQVTISPEQPGTRDDLVATWSGEEPDEGPGVQIRWLRDGVAVAGLTDATAPADATQKGERWTAEVTFDDGRHLPGVGTAEVWIANTAPEVTVSIAPPSPRAGESLLATAVAVDADNDAITADWSWQQDGAPAADATERVPPDVTHRDEVWKVSVVVSDDEAIGGSASAEVQIRNGLPTLRDLLITPAPITAVDAPAASVTATDADNDALTLGWTWRRARDGGAPEVIGTEPQLAAGLLQRGDVLDLTVTVTDGLEPGLPLSSPPLAVANALPELVDTPVISPPDPTVQSTLTCAGTATDPDGDATSVLAAWSQNGQPWSTGPSPSAVSLRKHDLVVCTLSPFDGVDTGAPRDSAPIEIRNSPPVVTSAAITPEFPSTDDFLGVIPGPILDADGDVVTLRYAWFRNQQLLSTDRALDPQLTARGDRVRVEITPFDDESAGPTYVSASVVVGDSPPVATGVQIGPEAPRGIDPIVATAQGTDPDGDAIVWRWQWFINDVPLADYDLDTLAPGLLVAGDRVAVEATPDDGQLQGAAVRSAELVVVDSPPTLASVQITPAEVFETSTLTCVASGLRDQDGDEATVSFTWSVNGANVATTETIDGARFNKGDRIQCTATPATADVTGRALTSNEVTAQNTAPTVQGAALDPAQPRRSVDARVVVGEVVDPDPTDTVTLRYAWTVNGALRSSNEVLPGDQFGRGDTVALTLTPSDGEDDGEPLTLGPAQVVNAAPVVTQISLTPTAVYTDTPLTAEVLASDPDGDDVTLQLVWRVNGVAAGGEALVLGDDAFARGDAVWLEVTPTDGTDAGPVASSAPITVLNRPPPAPAVSTSPRWPVENQDPLRCDVTGGVDLDGDQITYTIAWTVDSVPYPRPGDRGPVSDRRPLDTVSAEDARAGEQWTCTVTPFDLVEAGPTAQASISPIPVPIRNLTSGHWFTCGLDTSNKIRCWGNNDSGQGSAPVASAARLIAAYNETCAMDELGLMRCWGGNPLVTGFPFARYLDFSLNLLHGCGVRADRTLACWGDNTFGAATPPPGEGFVQVAAGYAHTCARRSDGSLTCWGLDIGPLLDAPVEAGFTDLASAAYFSCALSAQGDITCWGDTAELQFGPGPWRELSAGVVNMCAIGVDDHVECWGGDVIEPVPTGPFISVAPGAEHTCGVRTSGELVCWGSRLHGETTPPTVALDAISAGATSTCAVRDDGTPTCWGPPEDALTPPETVGGLISARVGRTLACGLDPAGGVTCWGDAEAPALPPTTRLALGDAHACALGTAGELACWGQDDRGQATAPAPTGWIDVAAAANHTCAVTDSGVIQCWGSDAYGETRPPDVVAVAVATGSRNSCAIVQDGTLTCWGDPTTGVTTPPSGVFLSVDVGREHACAIDLNGGATCWGDDTYAQLTPPGETFLEIDAGDDHTCGVTTALTARCWGIELR